MDDVEIRPARPVELEAVAGLRWRWVAERDGLPEEERAGFVDAFAAWAHDNTATHRCLVAVRTGTVLGMGFLAITPRAPTPAAVARSSGDLQCVYVVPEGRRDGLGGRLIDALLRLAAELGLERVTVHSSARAVPAYERHGFAMSPKLLQVSPAR
ncbi:GNAT family N-acetyltransferase [Amycolatopsis sp. FDAARGOS 1241]|uniref:GNAT family N-acetyltransferase n=1 Tax=Amycolatopsis sp. FDAARGOS 1241 TaxID=2778070 RepID=UPI00194DC1F2|nr:GNAT family N-acetyltransferase [Amycolatopsis sp. FDAARGOS 1241]QRP49797.1 GNAT family N-acetyltransferase [Amycolatopsis sp. FDAARGOS 1241]